jgi:hypothetical protein
MSDSRSPNARDCTLGSILRATTELVAWVSAPWAAAKLSWWVAIAVLLILVLLPSVFNVPGDKHQVGVPVSGPVRIGIELLLFASAVAGSAITWPPWAATLVAVLVLGAIATQLPRWRWLLQARVSPPKLSLSVDTDDP